MKLLKAIGVLFTVVCMFSTLTIQANVEKRNDIISIESNEGVVGSWDYHVPGVDPAYQNGIMHIIKENGEYAVNIELPGGTIPTEDVEVNGSEVKFALYIEGSRVDVNLVIDGDGLTGSGSSDQGPFTLTGSKGSSDQGPFTLTGSRKG